MIQELFGGGSAHPTGLLGDRKISFPFSSSSSSSPACPSSTAPIISAPGTTTTATTTAVLNSSNSPSGGANNSEAAQNLRCPRCDSTNTKFCYYNNYNLTQPRHFCKTCRRYWTKGGTLRNVPIGGGCRKNKTTVVTGSSAASGMSKSSNAMAKAKASLSTEMLVNGGNPGFLGNGLMDHLHYHPELQPGASQTLWPSLPQGQSSHILALLRGATQFPNPNPSPSPSPMSSAFTALKTEGASTLGLDPYSNGAPSLFGSYSRSNQHQLNGFGLGGSDIAQNGGNGSNILELYHRLKSSANYSTYCGNENSGAVGLSHVMGSTSTSSSSSAMNSTVLEAAPMGGDHLGGYGIMSSAISNWSEYPTVPINGAFP